MDEASVTEDFEGLKPILQYIFEIFKNLKESPTS